MFIRTLITSAALCGLLAQPAFADAETEALRAQVKMLEARLDAIEKKQTQQAAIPESQTLAPAGGVPANSSLQKRIDALEAKQATDDTQLRKLPNVEVGRGKGLVVTSPDKNFKLRIAGYIQSDDRTFFDNNTSQTGQADQFVIRSARPILEAKFYDVFSARLMWDFGNGTTQLLDAYLDYTPSELVNFRLGKFKDPIGLERWQAEQDVLFVERGLTTNLVPFRDNGIGIYGQPIAKAIEYQLTFTNGAADFVNGTNATDSPKTVTGRVFTHPFYYTDMPYLQGVGIGVAGSVGRHNGNTTSTDLSAGYVTVGQGRFFTYAASSFANGDNWRFNPQFMYYKGPLGLFGEYVLENQDLRSGSTLASLSNDAWMVAASYVLTGEEAKFEGGVNPRNDFDLSTGGWGAFEVVGRLSQLHIDSATFPTFASLSTSADAAYESTVGGTWYLNPMLKFNLDYTTTHFDRGAAGNAARSTEQAILTRAQFKF